MSSDLQQQRRQQATAESISKTRARKKESHLGLFCVSLVSFFVVPLVSYCPEATVSNEGPLGRT